MKNKPIVFWNGPLILLAFLPAIVTPLLEIALNRSTDQTDPAAVLAGLFVLTLFAITVWCLFRPRPSQIGLRLGKPKHYVIAILYVISVISLLLTSSALLGETNTELFGETTIDSVKFQKTIFKLTMIFISTSIVVFLTEEGYFRGVLWGAFENQMISPRQAYWCTSIAFAAWHIYLPFVEKEFEMPIWQAAIYLTNVALLSFAWGWIRLASGSMLLCCFVHGLWNALVYTLFGVGASLGAAGIERVWIYGPERGLLGVLLNCIALLLLIRFMRPAHS